jgi:hypothetical protein
MRHGKTRIPPDLLTSCSKRLVQARSVITVRLKPDTTDDLKGARPIGVSDFELCVSASLRRDSKSLRQAQQKQIAT